MLLGVLSVSGASILFQYATAEPLVVALYRLAFSVVLLAVPLLRQRNSRISRRDLGLSLLSGVFLALHFGTWFFSLKLTSVASSTVLVTMHPFIVLLYGYFAWGERTRGRALAGVLMAVAGAMLVSWGDFRLSSTALLGDLLALLGAVTVSGYFLIGRHVRQRVSAVQYSTLAYTSAAVVLLAASLAWGSPLSGFAPVNWWLFAALAVFPTIFGHTLFNWALKFVPASVISVSILGEPIGASILAWLIWGKVPGPLNLVGGTLILIGIGLFQWRRETT
ncbi:MAG TPA: DMT family transporter [Symbiobacteriaceae bacterium]|nr:DMT family transporter [Symbiobacteriaceae bacterium]